MNVVFTSEVGAGLWGSREQPVRTRPRLRLLARAAMNALGRIVAGALGTEDRESG